MKSENLEILKQNRIHVPDFFVLRFEDLILNHEQIIFEIEKYKTEIKQSELDLKMVSKKLQELIFQHFKQESIHNARQFFSDLLISEAGILFSVRSSCNFEDGKNFSFAGVFESFLDVYESEFEDYVLKCLQSLYSVKALEYAFLKEIDLSKLKMDVIIQKMVYGRCSGIGFSANPQGFLNEALITVGRGRGELIVNDLIPTTTYYINVDDKKYFYDGTEDLLSAKEIHALLSTMDEIKEILGFQYVDIEFCVGEQIYILQARPITGMQEGNITILDNSNIVESYPGVSLPLTQSFAKMVYTGVFGGVGRRILKNDALAEKYQDVYNNMVGVANGSLYYQINHWYKLLQFLPFSKKIIPVWQEMLGVNNKSYPLEDINLPKLSKFKTYFSFLYELFKVPKNMQALDLEFQEVYAHFQEVFHEDLSNIQLMDLFLQIKKRLIGIWDITLINDMYAFIFTGLLKSKLKKKYPHRYEEISLNLISGISNIESMKPMKNLIELAHIKREEGESTRYRESVQKYMELYADRALEELKLESLTFRTNPELLEQKIEDYCSDPAKLESLRAQLQLHEHENENVNAENQDIDKTLKRHLESGFYAKRAMKGIANRETSRLNRTRIFGMVRSIFLGIGRNLVKEGILQSERDIFYFEIDEVFDCIEKLDQLNNQAGAHNTKDSKTKDCKTEDSKTEDSKTKDSKTKDSKTKDSKTKDCKTKDCKTKDCKAKDCKAKDSKTEDYVNYDSLGNDSLGNDSLENNSLRNNSAKNDNAEQIQALKNHLHELALQRKVEYAVYEKLPIFHRIILNRKEIKRNFQHLNADAKNDGFRAQMDDESFAAQENSKRERIKTLQGVPSSSGKVSGEVVVIDRPQLNLNVKDKIIVTKMTDPGWVFLLANAKGIIAEKGSLLSHTAIISRELKIPAVVGVHNATSLLKTGDMVLLDADEGRIERIP